MALEKCWPIIRLGDACKKIGSGATPRGGKDSYIDSGIALIRSQNVYNEGFSRDGLAFIDDDQADQLGNVIVESRDVLINITGESVCRVCQVPDDVLPARVNQHVVIIRPDPTQIDAGFLRYHLLSPPVQGHLNALSSAGATRRALTKGMIEGLEVPLPCLPEQRAIANILGALDDKIELNRRMNETLEGIARALFKSWFVDFDPVRAKMDGRQPHGMTSEIAELFPSELVHVNGELIPKGWRIGRLDDLLVLQRGFDLPKKDRTDGAFPVIAAGGLHGTHAEAKVKGPGVVTGRSGVLGIVYYVHEDFWPLNTTLWVKEYRGSRPIHAVYFLRTVGLEGFNAGSAVPTLNRNHVHGLPVIVPPINVVKRFEDTAKPLFDQSRGKERESETLSALRDALLSKLLSGELRVPDAEKLAEEVL